MTDSTRKSVDPEVQHGKQPAGKDPEVQHGKQPAPAPEPHTDAAEADTEEAEPS